MAEVAEEGARARAHGVRDVARTPERRIDPDECEDKERNSGRE